DSYVPSDVTVVRPMEKVCILEGVHESEPGVITVPLEDFENYIYTNLKDFIRDNYDYIINYTGTNAGLQALKALLTATYDNCDPTDLFFDFCEEPELIDTEIVVSTVITGEMTKIQITGTSGTAEIEIEALDYLMTFDTDIKTTIENFINDYS